MEPQGIMIHCSATKDLDSSSVDAEQIDDWHKKRGWRCIGYHYVITRKGEVEKGRKNDQVGAHARGHNDTLGICMVGTQKFNEYQWATLYKLVIELMIEFEFNANDVHGHNEYSTKTCPGFDVEILRTTIRLLVERRIQDEICGVEELRH